MNLIVVPTYEEALTIGRLLDTIVGEPALGDFHVLVVDDASPDGTADAVRAHPDYGIRVHLLSRLGKSGLGSAYREGFAWTRDRGYGYSFQIESTWQVARHGMRVAEVPITSVERRAGLSKMSTAISVEALWRVLLWRIRAGRARTRWMQEQAA